MSRDYGTFRAGAETAAAAHTYETTCPICGTPVDTNERGLSNCPEGHWRGRRTPDGYTTGPNRF